MRVVNDRTGALLNRAQKSIFARYKNRCDGHFSHHFKRTFFVFVGTEKRVTCIPPHIFTASVRNIQFYECVRTRTRVFRVGKSQVFAKG